MKNLVSLYIFLSAAVFGASLVTMPATAFSKTPNGECTIQFLGSAAHEAVPVWGWEHEILSPRDVAASSHRQQQPLRFIVRLGKTAPYFTQTIVDDPRVGDARLSCVDASEQVYYAIELRNATVASIRAEMLNNKYPGNAVAVEELTIAHESIERVR